ncbi:hypothetical protein M1770_02085 [Spiroplasma citri]|uniref:hypothetical protein n=1 Tax=Spiroplasma citri TaxID=2133 RepID=UPI00241232D7|nr:hypothetical protein [Spiroplasma citri]WFG98779.1 hypothetical protein M1770_02085 [Spiroplasma citri]
MRKILTLLTTFLITSASITSVISCGTISPPKIAGRENISTEFTLTNNVIVTDDNMTVEESIFNQAKSEGRISQDLSLDFFEITDAENMVKPTSANTPQTGDVVLTVRQDEDIPYIGSITIRFTLVKKLSMDISQTVNLKNVWDVTKYENVEELYNDIWEKAVGSFKPETPIDIETYDISGFDLPSVYNTKLPVTMFAEYNGKANTPTSLFSGTIITFNLNIISYRAMVNLKLQQNNLDPTLLYDLVWKEVKQQFSDDHGVSSDYNDYQVEWSDMIEPDIGGNTQLNFLATPNNENIHHYMRVEGFIFKDQIELPSTIELSIPIVVTQQERPNVDKDWIWKLAMRKVNINGGPALTNFNTTDWQTIFSKNWPNIGRTETVTLRAVNRNTDPMFKGDVKITLKLINQGIDPGLLELDPILLVKSDNHTTDSVLHLVWDKLINNKAWNPHLSRDLVNFKPEDLDRLSNALRDAENSEEWESYAINISGKQEDAGGDFKITVHGKIKMVNKAIEKDAIIDLSDKTYNFMPRKQFGSDNQVSYLVHQIWGDIIKNSIFTANDEQNFGLSKIQTDWNYFEPIYQQIDEAINKYDANSSGDKIPLELKFSFRNNAIYTGQVTVKLNLTASEPINLDFNLTSSMLPIFIRSLPTPSEDKKELVKNMVNTILYDGIIKNPDLKAQQRNILWQLLSYDTTTKEFIEQFNFPTESNPQRELIINIKTSYGQFVNGSFMLKINLIYQP